jgi:hypothetical protein
MLYVSAKLKNRKKKITSTNPQIFNIVQELKFYYSLTFNRLAIFYLHYKQVLRIQNKVKREKSPHLY